jgi:hypothetical protein
MIIVVIIPSTGVGKCILGSLIHSAKMHESRALPSQPVQTYVKQISRLVKHMKSCVVFDLGKAQSSDWTRVH